MEIKRTTEIFCETTRRFVVRRQSEAATIFCPACGEAMLAAEAAAAVFQINCRRVYRFVEAGAAHFLETEAGATLVCLSSLGAAIGNLDDAPPVEIAGLTANAATENPAGEI